MLIQMSINCLYAIVDFVIQIPVSWVAQISISLKFKMAAGAIKWGTVPEKFLRDNTF